MLLLMIFSVILVLYVTAGHSVTEHIISKRTVGYVSLVPDLLSIPRFNTRYMKDSIAHRGALLWNYLTSKHRELVNFTCYGNLKRKLSLFDNFKNFTFKVASASTCTFRSEDFVYT